MTIGVRKQRKSNCVELLDTSSKTENRVIAILTMEQVKTLIEVLVAVTKST